MNLKYGYVCQSNPSRVSMSPWSAFQDVKTKKTKGMKSFHGWSKGKTLRTHRLGR